MPKCIFCRSTTNTFSTREHILPESIGGGDWAVLPDGLLCDECQNRFGSTVEQQALADYPFSFFRVLLGIPTKKGKPAWLDSWEGVLQSTARPGLLSYNPAPPFEESVSRKQKTVLRILAEPRKPRMVCRALLKMGIEVVASDDPGIVFHQKFDEARAFALLGRKTKNWWYIQHEDMSAFSKYIANGIQPQEWIKNVELEVTGTEDGPEVFHLKLLYMDLITPLEPQVNPPAGEDLSEPEYRLFVV
jgi:hypothetical protein